MKLAYEWLSDYLDLSAISPEEMGEKLSRTGIEVDAVTHLDGNIDGLIVGQIEKIEAHPQADKLRVTTINIGDKRLQIVCGDPLIQEGQKVIVAQIGAHLPAGVKIKKGKLRGVVSEGMLCSLEELGFSDSVVAKEDKNRVFSVPNEIEIGSDPLEALKMHQAIVELDITPNRADALSMRGSVREISAVYGLDNSLSPDQALTNSTDHTETFSVNVEADSVKEYNLLAIKGVKIAPSPLWLKARLMHAGIRPINNVVDVTNYILMEYGQPLHAFDGDKIKGKGLLVRYAKEGEKLVTLDGQEQKLLTTDVVISDENGPVALAGVMGGLDSEITEETTTVWLEAALFNGIEIRQTSKRLNMRSESSVRFERGINQATVLEAGLKAAEMITELAGGKLEEAIASVSRLDFDLPTIDLHLTRLNQVLGTDLSLDTVERILKQLDFNYTLNGETFSVEVPKRRYDLSIEEDMIEEVARIYGYDNIPMTLPKVDGHSFGLTPSQILRRRVEDVLVGEGLSQAISYALTTKERSEFLKVGESVELAMPMSRDRSAVRQSVVASLLESVSYNVNHHLSDVALYELGNIFYHDEDSLGGQPHQVYHLGIALTGNRQANDWYAKARPVDFYDAKGLVEEVLSTLRLSDQVIYQAASHYEGMHPTQTAEILLRGKVVGLVGRLHPKMEKAYGLKQTYLAEVNLDAVFKCYRPLTAYTPVVKHPTSSRDLSILMDRAISFAQVKEVIQKIAGKLLMDIHLFDIYQGKGIEPDKKSMAVNLTFQGKDRTLTDEEIDERIEKIKEALVESLSVEIR